MSTIKKNNDFDIVLKLIEEAKRNAFQKLNEELITLYYKIGGIVSTKVTKGLWGDKTVRSK